jgi:hypothetical protein
LTLARSYGHASWPKLKTYVEAVTIYARDPHELAPRPDAADEFMRLACLVYGGDDLTRPARAAEMLRRDPSLAGRSIQTAAVVGDVAAAARMLAGDRSLASATGGPFGWEPLLYVAYSRLVSDDPRHSHLAVARLLLDHGADPNAGYLWDGTYLFTALTGAFGYGEDAPNQPPHHESLALARLLLEAGADPNDDQTIYNRRELARDPSLAEAVMQRHPRALMDAAEHGNADGVELLARIGFDVNRRDDQVALHLAAYTGNREVCALLLRLGADPTIRDSAFDAPAAGWARHAHHDELAAWLQEASARAG